MSNRQPNYLMNAIAGWKTAASSSVAFAAKSGLTLQPLPGSMRPLVDAEGSLGGLQSAIGVAVDEQDNIYILDVGECAVKRFDRCEQRFIRLHCVGGCGDEPRKLRDPHGLAISACNNLYLADTGNRRVQVFSLGELALRAIWGPLQVTQTSSGYAIDPSIPTVQPPDKGCAAKFVYPSGTWAPWDVGIGADGTICVSDHANGLIHYFDAAGCWRFASNGAATGQPALVKPTRIAIDKSGRVYVIQEGVATVVVLSKDGEFLDTVPQPAQITGDFRPVAVAVDMNGDLCLSDCLTRKLYFFQPTGDGSWCPCNCCGTSQAFATSLIFDRTGAPLFVDGAQGLCQMEPAAAYPTSGTYIAGPLDSRIYKCVWHRVVLNGIVPQGAGVRVDTFTSEATKSTAEVQSLPASRWATGLIDTDDSGCEWDCLVLSVPGRYLWLRLTLTGDGAETAAIDEVRVYYPRQSSLQYLPPVYSADAISADFLDRFLSIFDTIRGGVSERVTNIARYFDPMATPATPETAGGTDFLSYLGSWIGMSLQSNWPVHRRRELVRQAHRLYALRGTPGGLRLAIELYTGVKPTILEMFRLRRWLIVNQSKLGDCSSVFGAEVMQRLQVGSNSTIGSFRLIDYGDPTLDLFNEYANQFLVIVPRWPGAGDSDLQNLQQIVQMAQPAHTEATVQWAEARLRVGIQAFVGVDTIVGKYPIGVIEGQGTLGYDTVLGTPGRENERPSIRVGRDTRLGSTSVLN